MRGKKWVELSEQVHHPGQLDLGELSRVLCVELSRVELSLWRVVWTNFFYTRVQNKWLKIKIIDELLTFVVLHVMLQNHTIIVNDHYNSVL